MTNVAPGTSGFAARRTALIPIDSACLGEVDSLPGAFGLPPLRGALRLMPADFAVEEMLGFEPDGSGQHRLIHLQKRELNTAEVADALARLAGVARSAVGYGGRKDRRALTSQWFSVDLAGSEEPDWTQGLAETFGDRVRLLAAAPHRRKLRIGTLTGNRFRIRVRGVSGDRTAAEARWAQILAGGVPNYFGPQRFGELGDNVRQALAWFAGERLTRRSLRDLLLSSARSALFNQLLAERVREGSWKQAERGDVLQLDGRGSWFVFGINDAPDDIAHRVDEGDLHPTGPLWGAGEPATGERIGVLERSLSVAYPELAAGLVRFGLRQDRRALRVMPRDGRLLWQEDDVELTFALPPGAFATSVLKELLQAPAPLSERAPGAGKLTHPEDDLIEEAG
jgi:tRNA pseudouridine13 synthase